MSNLLVSHSLQSLLSHPYHSTVTNTFTAYLNPTNYYLLNFNLALLNTPRAISSTFLSPIQSKPYPSRYVCSSAHLGHVLCTPFTDHTSLLSFFSFLFFSFLFFWLELIFVDHAYLNTTTRPYPKYHLKNFIPKHAFSHRKSRQSIA